MDYKERLIEYLKAAKDYCDTEIENHKGLSVDEKADLGLVIREAAVNPPIGVGCNGELQFSFRENPTKIRIGDKVFIYPSTTNRTSNTTFTVLEVSTDYVIVDAGNNLFVDSMSWNIEVAEASMFDTYISILESMDESSPGMYFLKQLSGEEIPSDESIFGADPRAIKLSNQLSGKLNDNQIDAVYYSIKQPSLRLIQGPPGTGKTHVLSCIASIMSAIGNEVAVVAKTHQAVNNALNAIKHRSPNLNVIKIGQSFRSDGLDDSIYSFAKYQDYLRWRKQKKGRVAADVVGMTLQASTVNMCLRNSGFKPQMILVDEASQIPLAEASIIGASGAGSIIFIGDDRQMPPIFVESLEHDPLSISIFEHLANLHPFCKDVLNVTYRMNDEICEYVSAHFYEPFHIQLISEEVTAIQRMILDVSEEVDERMEIIFSANSPSLVTLDVSGQNFWQDDNAEEALFAAQVASVAMNHGVNKEEIAIVTPFRKQVNRIRAALRLPQNDCPIVDTVERLQGQDVRLIILSFSVTDEQYYREVKSFLHNPKRLNVMISRAKEKVLILKSKMIEL